MILHTLSESSSSCCYMDNEDCEIMMQPQNDDQHCCSSRSVRFSLDQSTVCEIPSRDDYTVQEAQATWYTASDYKSFKKAAIVTLKLNRAGELPASDKEHTMRGLECRTREGVAQRKALKEHAKKVVLDEQERQCQQHGRLVDLVAVAKVYQPVSAPEQYQATVQGMCDELEARDMAHLAKVVRSTGLNHKKMVANSNANARASHTRSLQGILDYTSIKVVSGPAA